MLAQMPDHITSHHAVVQVIVRQDQFRGLAGQGRQRRVFIGGGDHVAAPLPEQRTHAFEDAHFIVQHQQSPARQRITRARLRRREADGQRHLAGYRYLDAEHRSAARKRVHLDAVVEDFRDALDDRQPQPHALAVGGAAHVQLIEFEEDGVQAIGGNAASGVPHFQAQLVAPATGPQQDAAFVGVATGVTEEVAQDPGHQAQVGANGVIAHVHAQPQAGGLGHGLELRDQWPEQFVEAVQRDIRLDRRLIEAGDVQQVGEQVLGAFQRLMRAFDQHLLDLGQLALAQGRDQQPRGVERLQQVMTRRSEVFVLAAVGGLRGVPGIAQGFGDLFTLGDLLLQVAVGFQQFIGARGHPLLQFVVELLQALLGELAFGDVGDEAFHQPFLVGLEQQVHQHVEMAAVLAPQLGFIAVQAALVGEDFADVFQLLGTTDKQVARQVRQGEQHLLRVLITKHARQGRVGGAHAVVQAGLENPVDRVFEQPFVAIALGFQLVQARGQFRVMALARRMTA
ncbi:hypothetical protein D3C76_735110 [compost metagenome]